MNDGNDWWHSLQMSSREVNVDRIARVLTHVDGVIGRNISEEIVDELEGQEVPTVVLRSASAGDLPESEFVCEAAHVDDACVGAMAVLEIERIGLKNWGFVGYEGVGWSRSRGEAMMNKDAEVYAVELTEEERSGWGGVLRLMNWLCEVPKPIAIFGCCDEAGVAVTQACGMAGISVPSEVIVLGVDNDVRLCQASFPPLSSIDLQAFSVGKRAAWQMAKILGMEVGEEPEILAPRLLARESSHDVDRYFLCYRKAVEWLAENALRGPKVEELSEVSGVSRRGLERAFSKHANVSPASVIRNYRLKAIEELLVRENLSLERVASQAGFADPAGLSNFVRRQKDMSPRELREFLLGDD